MPTQHNVTPAYSDMERHNTIDIKTLPSMPPHDEQVPTPSVNSDPPPQPSEAMVFAAQAIENMIHDDIEKSQETPVTLSEHKLAPQHLPAMTQQGGDLDHSTDQQHEEDDGLDQSKQQQQEQPDVASLKKDDTKKQPSSIKSTESGQFRFKPVPNPTFSQQPSSAPVMNRQTSTENDQQLTQLISAAALVAEGVHHETDDTIHLTDDEEEEEQDKYRPPPKDEKWVISSIRRPQMVPVRSPNARVYDGTSPRSSMIRSSLVLPDHPPEATTSTSGGKANRPQLKIDIPNKETKVAAQEVIAAGRALAQNHQQQNDTMGIRPPPWQQQEEYRRQPYESTNYNNQRYSQQQGGLNRNVSGPRVAPDTITADNRKNTNKEFNKFIKGGRKSTLSPPPPPQEGPKHEPPNKKGGRFSLGIFGNKKDKRGPPPQRNTLPPTSDVFISGPPGGGPISTQPDNINNDNSNAVNTDSIPSNHPDLTSDGSPIMHYARAVWSFTATIPMEMSFSAGDRLAIVKKQADGWWDAELQGPTKTRGLVPGNYMEID
ncbi:hypothetical protein BC941DRAFT_35179 [Chlamydoabsidia padenii]|nr:hypothetical protein BC941DRAFT_35179 [Chlamydoabsidia padenii]